MENIEMRKVIRATIHTAVFGSAVIGGVGAGIVALEHASRHPEAPSGPICNGSSRYRDASRIVSFVQSNIQPLEAEEMIIDDRRKDNLENAISTVATRATTCSDDSFAEAATFVPDGYKQIIVRVGVIVRERRELAKQWVSGNHQ